MTEPGAATPGTLHIVSTPIGNLGDLTLRAIEVLQQVGAILAEDTRHSRVLCERHGIRTPLLAYHEHNEAEATPRFVERLLAGESFALITDAERAVSARAPSPRSSPSRTRRRSTKRPIAWRRRWPISPPPARARGKPSWRAN